VQANPFSRGSDLYLLFLLYFPGEEFLFWKVRVFALRVFGAVYFWGLGFGQLRGTQVPLIGKVFCPGMSAG
jgi:hypothetical protein